MEWLVVAIVAALAALLALAASRARMRGRLLDEVRDVARLAGESSPDALASVRRLRRRVELAEAQVEAERRDLAGLAEAAGVGVIRIGDDGRIELANATAHVLLGRPAGALVGRTAVEAFVHRRVDQIVAQARAGAAAGGEVRLGPGDARTLVVRARRSPKGGVWVGLEDVSELRRLQHIRAEFIDNLGHELRTPLATVSLLAETLARDAAQAGEGVPDRMRDRIGKIEVETGHVVQMVNELLDLSRIESGGGVGDLEPVDAGGLAETSVERLRLFAERQGVTLRVLAAEGLPPVLGDESRLGQVLVNLLHNAVKFSPPDSEVVVRVRERDGEVVTSVEDHGVGIPRAAVDRVFERFYKVDRARARGGGTGLGLAIARHVVEQHGGRIWVESEEGSGSTFSIALPAAVQPGP